MEQKVNCGSTTSHHPHVHVHTKHMACPYSAGVAHTVNEHNKGNEPERAETDERMKIESVITRPYPPPRVMGVRRTNPAN